MTKNKMLSKLNFKDYNNELELVLEKKDFSVDAKNLLLSMLYKVETGYKDYKRVKQDVVSKESFIETIINTIKIDCDKIEFIRPIEGITSTFKIIPEEKKIKCYQNETSLLEAIISLEEKYFYIDEEYSKLAYPMQELLIKGYEADKHEIISDFDGWSWNPSKDCSIYMKCYEVLRILMGNNFVYEWKRDRRTRNDYLVEIRKYSENLYSCLYNIAILLYSKDAKQKKQIIDTKNAFVQELEKMDNKKEYLKDVYAKRRILNDEIKKYDKIINNKELLTQEFETRNKLLEDEEKIFSISDLVDILQKEKEQTNVQMKEVTSLAQPKIYIEKAKHIKEKVELVERIEKSLTSNKKIDEAIENNLKELEEIFAACLEYELEKKENKKEVIEILYHYRYFCYIIGNKNEIAKKIITKACRLKAITILHEDVEYNSRIIEKVISNSIIELGNIILILKTSDKLEIEIFDGETFDRIEEMELPKEKKFTVRLGKKIKLLE